MGRQKKTDATNAELPEMEEVLDEMAPSEVEPEGTQEINEAPVQADEPQEDIPANVVAIMRLNPQYEELWITPRGFVHPVGAPEYLLKGAKLYKNKFFNK